MEPIVSVDEMRRIDATTTVDIDRLMDAAGNGIALSAAGMGIGYGSVVHVRKQDQHFVVGVQLD